ncbi:Nn.00g002120.m01.CDS01 [Neocucurbitaria sp. VM-36]
MEEDHFEAVRPASATGPAILTPDTASQMEDSETKTTDQQARLSKPSTTPNRRRTKLKLAAPRMLLIISCLAYLTTAFVAIDFGLFSVSNFIKPRLQWATLEWRVHSSIAQLEMLLSTELDSLLSSQLSRGFLESHEECLARGLRTADDQFISFWLAYPDIRNQTMDWVMDNCGRLLYTPQVSDPSLQQAVWVYLAQASYRGRQMAQGVLEFVKQKTYWILDWLCNTDPVWDSPIYFERVSAYNPALTSLSQKQIRPKMPFDFALDCDNYGPCRLVYPLLSGLPVEKAMISAEAVSKSMRKTHQLRTLTANLGALRRVANPLVSVFLLAQGFLLVICDLIGAFVPETALPSTTTFEEGRPTIDTNLLPISKATKLHVSKEQKYVICFATIEVVSLLVSMFLEHATSSGSTLIMMLGVYMAMVGFSMLIGFLVPPRQLENVLPVRELVKELYQIIRARKIPDTAGDQKGSEDAGALTEVEEASSQFGKGGSSDSEDSSQTDLTAKYEEQNDATRSELDTDTEPDSDSDADIDEESFTDLAGSVTPPLTGVDSDWSVVDA